MVVVVVLSEKTSSEVMHLLCIISVYDSTTSRGGRLASLV